jgi:quercetin dioxygenase-like cupin family protein/alkylhydroperoxidase/carboxymuconolactone decarboxylase family protein YurZ
MRLASAMVLACASFMASAAQAQPEALTDRQAGIVTVAAFTANGDLPKLKIALNQALDAGLTINEIKELLVQMYAYAGFPRSLNAINAFDEVVQQRRQQGKQDAAGRAPGPLPANKTSLELGDEIRTKLTGSTAVAGYARFVPIIDDFLKAHLFGDIFGRDNLDYQSREIATISALATLHGLQAQLRGHFNVGLNVGLSEPQLRGLLSIVSSRVDEKQAESALRLLDETVRARAVPGSKPDTASVASSTGGKSVDRLIVTSPGTQPRAAPESNFTGSVSVASPFKATGEARLGGATVTFQSGARTHWHSHPLGQLLVVTAGEGWVQVEDEAVRTIKPGDVVWTAPGVKHWHGATPTNSMTHVAVAESIEGAAVQWLEPVSNSQYRARD